jgi:hypothetical protein
MQAACSLAQRPGKLLNKNKIGPWALLIFGLVVLVVGTITSAIQYHEKD